MNLEIFLILLVSGLIGVIFYLLSKQNTQTDNTSLKLLQEQILNLNKTIDYKLWESNRNVSKNFETSSKINVESTKKIEEITKKLTNLEETNKQIKDIWGQLEWLESILKNPKQRGVLWEYFLESVLKNILPPDNYSLQYSFKNGEAVDAVIFVKDKIIPIDSTLIFELVSKFFETIEYLRLRQNMKKKSTKKNLEMTSKRE